MTDELAKTIERLEQWVEHWQPHYPPELRVLPVPHLAQCVVGAVGWGVHRP